MSVTTAEDGLPALPVKVPDYRLPAPSVGGLASTLREAGRALRENNTVAAGRALEYAATLLERRAGPQGQHGR